MRWGLLATVPALLMACPAAMAVNVYVTDYGVGKVSQFEAGLGGALSFLSPETVPAGTAPDGIAVSPNGDSVYMVDTNKNTVLQFSVEVGGALVPKSPASVGTGEAPRQVAVSPDGSSVYVTNELGDSVSQFSVGTGGTLTPKSPAAVASGGLEEFEPEGIVVSPDGKHVYVVNSTHSISSKDGSVAELTVGAGGVLSPATLPPSVLAGEAPFGIAESPDGANVYVTNDLGDTVSEFSVAGDGTLSLIGSQLTGLTPRGIAVSPNGKSVYVTDGASTTVLQFSVEAGGALSPLSPPEVTSGSGPFAIAISPDGTGVYVANNTEDTVSHFSVAAGGELSFKGSISTLNPAAGSQPRGIAVGSGPTSEGEKHTPPVETPKETPSTTGGASGSTATAGSSTSTAGASPGVASTPKGIEELLLGCSSSQLVLNDAYIHGGRVLLSGSAAKSLTGKKVKILFNEGKQVATATVGANGEFATTAPLPPAKIRDSLSTRYTAEVGKLRSLHLKLVRRLLLEPLKASGTTVTLTGQVTLPLTKPITPIVVEEQLECGKTVVAKTFTPPSSGRFHIVLTVPANARAGIFRLTSKVAANKHAIKHGFTTFSLPLPVVLG